ncbi:DNA adenine methylase [Parvibaculum sp.]|uniref:DNA adenine methylase n=1 Tax=Parvibaculum sp. TaxID=2024848 RepID=UPI0026021B9B|nr:DNA adenine methylase [Parvibaculum sp.]MCW5725863.1 DNA adenine methylase [Parvibaculum sp.]
MNQIAPKLDLFDDVYPPEPPTEGIKYAGSKKKLLPQILWLAGKTGAKAVLDGFAGSTRVSQAFAQSGYHVTCNDKAIWSEVLGNCYLKSKPADAYRSLIAHLNDCKPVDGWFTAHYGGPARSDDENTPVKMPWQFHNTRKLDGIREEIDRLGLEADEKAVALTSLMLALDRVDSTLGHFSSYLREWSPRSFNTMHLKVPKILQSRGDHKVVRGDVFRAASTTDAELAYFDPPYGSNNEKMPPSRVRYSAYYHVWTTICLNDKPKLFGKVNRRVDTRDNADPCVFEEYRKNSDGRFIAVESVHKLIREASSRHIILSYSSGGRATAAELHEVISETGKLREVIEVDHRKNVMSTMAWTNEWLRDAQEPNREFLFLVDKY